MRTPRWPGGRRDVVTRVRVISGQRGSTDGEGFSDVIVGADQFDGGLADEARAFVFVASAASFATTPAWTAEGNR